MNWISVKDKLPDRGVDVLVWLSDDGWCEVAFYTLAGKWFTEDDIGTHVCSPSHWMPLPEGPGGK